MAEVIRTTISLEPPIFEAAQLAAAKDKRSFSNFVEVAISAFIAAMPTGDAAETAAVAEARAAGVDVVETLARAARAKTKSKRAA